MTNFDVIVEGDGWDRAGLEALAVTACAATLASLDLSADRFEVSILGCTDARIAALNADFRRKPTPTNVLSWPARDISLPLGEMPDLPQPLPDDPREELGDIAIAFEMCTAEAAAQGKPFEAHVTHLLVHATLHLLGFDHIHDPDAAIMERLETRILATLGVPDPY